MTEIKRYGREWECIAETPDGEYVRYEDVADLLAERDPTPVTAEWLDGVMGDDGEAGSGWERWVVNDVLVSRCRDSWILCIGMRTKKNQPVATC